MSPSVPPSLGGTSHYFYRKIRVCRWVGGELGKLVRLRKLMRLRKFSEFNEIKEIREIREQSAF